jgi:transposase InsO family protein
VDLVGPWTLTIGGYEHKFIGLTIIDMVTNIVELVRLDNKTSEHVAMHFENTWLSRYQKPLHCIHDQGGGEFTGFPFQRLLHRMNIRSHPTSVKNPQANVICERIPFNGHENAKITENKTKGLYNIYIIYIYIYI